MSTDQGTAQGTIHKYDSVYLETGDGALPLPAANGKQLPLSWFDLFYLTLNGGHLPAVEGAVKGNPYHDPESGRFANAPAGSGAGAGAGGGEAPFGTSPIKNTRPIAGLGAQGVNRADTHVIEFEDGTRGIWKPRAGRRGDADVEVAAYHLSEIIGGGVPETSYMSLDGRPGTVQRWVDGKLAMQVPIERVERLGWPKNADAIVALDCIIYNSDRHDANLIFGRGGVGHAIDNDLAQFKRWTGGIRDQSWGHRNYITGVVQRKDRYKFDQGFVDRLSRVTRGQVEAAISKTKMDRRDRETATENAWYNLQHIVKNGSLSWDWRDDQSAKWLPAFLEALNLGHLPALNLGHLPAVEGAAKGNPYHDPESGRFTNAPAGSGAGAGAGGVKDGLAAELDLDPLTTGHSASLVDQGSGAGIRLDIVAPYKPIGDPGTVSVPERVRRSLDEIEGVIADDPLESAYFVDPFTGGRLERFVGNNKEVKIPRRILNAEDDMAGTILTHNHPSGDALSLPDITMALNLDLAQIRAVSQERTSILQLPYGIPWKTRSDIAKQVRRIFEDVSAVGRDKYRTATNSKERNAAERWYRSTWNSRVRDHLSTYGITWVETDPPRRRHAGKWLPTFLEALAGAVKGNPYHDPETGRFTNAPAGSGVSLSQGTGSTAEQYGTPEQAFMATYGGGHSPGSERWPFRATDQLNRRGDPDAVKNSEELEQKLAWAEAEIANDRRETAYLFEQNGELIRRIPGEAHSVTIPPEAARPGMVLTHNHPNGASLSVQDIQLAIQQGAHQIRAVSKVRTCILQLPRHWTSGDRYMLSDYVEMHYSTAYAWGMKNWSKGFGSRDNVLPLDAFTRARFTKTVMDYLESYGATYVETDPPAWRPGPGGKWLPIFLEALLKGNPYHDPETGRFASAPAGSGGGPQVIGVGVVDRGTGAGVADESVEPFEAFGEEHLDSVRLPEAVERTLREIESVIADDPVETLYIVDPKTGEIAHRWTGDEDSVTLPAEFHRPGSLRGMVMTHNHPIGTGLSYMDVGTALVMEARQIRAVSQDRVAIIDIPSSLTREGRRYLADGQKGIWSILEQQGLKQIHPLSSTPEERNRLSQWLRKEWTNQARGFLSNTGVKWIQTPSPYQTGASKWFSAFLEALNLGHLPALSGPPKGNPYHDPETGRFTSAPAGSGGGAGAGTAGDGDVRFAAGRITSSRALSSGVNKSVILEFEDGTKGLWKPMTGDAGFHDGNSEVAAYQLSRIIGGNVPPTAFLDYEGRSGTVQKWVEGTLAAEAPAAWFDERGWPTNADEIIALDTIIYNADRHPSNYLIDPSTGAGYAIDNGHAQWVNWKESNYAPGWRNDLTAGIPSSHYEFDRAYVDRLAKVTREQFNAAFAGVSTSSNVKPENAWANLQQIVSDGYIDWYRGIGQRVIVGGRRAESQPAKWFPTFLEALNSGHLPALNLGHLPAVEGAAKGNPYHDPETGRFTSAPAGSGSTDEDIPGYDGEKIKPLVFSDDPWIVAIRDRGSGSGTLAGFAPPLDPVGDPESVRLSQNAEKQLALIESVISDDPVESAYVVDPVKGNIRYRMHGDSEHVELGPWLTHEPGRLSGMCLTHNHPTGGSFSPEDLQAGLYTHARQIRVVNRERTAIVDFPDSLTEGERAVLRVEINSQVLGAHLKVLAPRGGTLPSDPRARADMSIEASRLWQSALRERFKEYGIRWVETSPPSLRSSASSKGNPYHDPESGRFTNAPAGSGGGAGAGQVNLVKAEGGLGYMFRTTSDPAELDALMADHGLSSAGLMESLTLPGLRCQASIARADGFGSEERARQDRIEIRAEYYDTDGNLAGRYHTDVWHGGKAYLHSLSMAEMGHGQGTQLVRQQLDYLEANGVTEAGLFANITIGRYAWAREGADYLSGDAGDMGHKFAKWLDKRGVPLPTDWPAPWPTPDRKNDTVETWEAFLEHGYEDASNYWKGRFAGQGPAAWASLKHPNGYTLTGRDIHNRDVPPDMVLSLGKAFMLDDEGHGSWDGVIRLGNRRRRR